MNTEPQYLKVNCPICAGSIEFSEEDHGRSASCPHCHAEIVLEIRISTKFEDYRNVKGKRVRKVTLWSATAGFAFVGIMSWLLFSFPEHRVEILTAVAQMAVAAIAVGFTIVLIAALRSSSRPHSNTTLFRPREEFICARCGTQRAINKRPGSDGVEVILWLWILIPGLIYSIWRSSGRKLVCDACGSTEIMPLRTPGGRKTWLSYYSE